jgi:hypothetical protein
MASRVPRILLEEFFQRRMAQAAAEIGRTRVERGAVIWKLYDHAFVVRTRTVTLGFDLARRHREPYWLTYERFAGSAAPCVVMTWGESFQYRGAPETDAAR